MMATSSWRGYLAVQHNEHKQFVKVLAGAATKWCQTFSIGAANGNACIAYATPDELHINYAVSGEWMQSLEITEPVISICWNPSNETIALNMDSGWSHYAVFRV